MALDLEGIGDLAHQGRRHLIEKDLVGALRLSYMLTPLLRMIACTFNRTPQPIANLGDFHGHNCSRAPTSHVQPASKRYDPIDARLVLLTPALASAQQTAVREEPLVVTSGEGIVQAVPDRAWITITAESRGSSPREAQRRNTEAMTPVQDKLRAAGIPADAIRTVGYDLQQEWDFVNNKRVSAVTSRATRSTSASTPSIASVSSSNWRSAPVRPRWAASAST